MPGSAGEGCSFVDRCSMAEVRCRSGRPELLALPDGGATRCHFWEKTALMKSVGATATPQRIKADADAPALVLSDLSISYAKPNLLEQFVTKYSSGRLRTTGAIAAGVAVLVILIFLVQQNWATKLNLSLKLKTWEIKAWIFVFILCLFLIIILWQALTMF